MVPKTTQLNKINGARVSAILSKTLQIYQTESTDRADSCNSSRLGFNAENIPCLVTGNEIKIEKNEDLNGDKAVANKKGIISAFIEC